MAPHVELAFPRLCKDRVRVAIDETRHHYEAIEVEFFGCSIVAHDVRRGANRNNAAVLDRNRTVFDDP